MRANPIAVSTIVKKNMTVPKAVRRVLGATAHTKLEWYPASVDVPQQEIDSFLLVRVAKEDDSKRLID